jgi:hypothetical protein
MMSGSSSAMSILIGLVSIIDGVKIPLNQQMSKIVLY